MTAGRLLVMKEFRALLPMWSAVMAVMLADLLLATSRLNETALLAYALGSLALGAYAIGHEHSHRTLAMLLAQPIDRRSLLLAKLAVLAPMLFAMGALAWHGAAEVLRPPALALVLLPVLGGLTLAPLLTMLTRNQLGGVMLTGMIGGWSLITTSVLTVELSGLPVREAEQLAGLIWALEMCATVAIAAVLAWRTFMRLEAIDGPAGKPLHLPRWFRAARAARASHPLAMLVRKELRLQQLSFVIAGIFVAGWAALFARDYALGSPATEIASVLEALSAVYLLAVGITAGAMASAEERQSGMLESQLLLPVSARAQWLVKAGVAVVVALLLGLLPPAAISAIAGPGNLRGMLPSPLVSAVLILVVTACSLYVSSISSSGIRALTLAFPFVVAAYLFAVFVGRRLPLLEMGILGTALAFACALLAFAGANHRRTDRSLTRVLIQLGTAAAIIAVGLPGLSELLRWAR